MKRSFIAEVLFMTPVRGRKKLLKIEKPVSVFKCCLGHAL